jgi:hypothetical protein
MTIALIKSVTYILLCQQELAPGQPCAQAIRMSNPQSTNGAVSCPTCGAFYELDYYAGQAEYISTQRPMQALQQCGDVGEDNRRLAEAMAKEEPPEYERRIR